MGELLTFEPTNSNHVRHLAYDPEESTLKVTFANGASYTHQKVPAKVFAQMTRHHSIGQFYHRVIRVHYPIYKPKPYGSQDQAEA